ncbi:MAG: ankyrin repeat domain-containing protein [Actinomycetota bacterium]|nr:ankyrin repeat domain-containing protein [Actinomycetota bacterium]
MTTSALFAAIDSGDTDQLESLLAAQPALAGARNGRGLSAVRAALNGGHRELVDPILAAEPTLDVFDASAVGDVDRLRLLLDDDPDLVNDADVDGFTPLHLAAFFGKPKIVELLLARSANPDAHATNGSALRPLNSAAAAGHHSIAHLLLDHGAEVDPRQTGGFTPLHSAAHNGDAVMVHLLLERGADPGALADDGRTAADLAVSHPQVLGLLT